MLESPTDLAQLQGLLDESHRRAGPQLRRIFDSSRASAAGVVDRLPGIFEIHLSSLSGSGAPLVSPIDALFIKGKVWFSLSGESVRSRLVRRDPRVSASHTDGTFGLVVHGTARPFTDGDADFEEIDSHVSSIYVAQYGEVWHQWREHITREQGPGFSAWIDARVMFAKQ